MKKLICVCCGAPINRATRRCEYCGTEYNIDSEIPMVRFETFTNPVKEYSASCLIDRDLVAMDGEKYMQYAIEHLAHAMLPAVMEGMRVWVQDLDYEAHMRNQRRINGTIKIVVPKNVETGWR